MNRCLAYLVFCFFSGVLWAGNIAMLTDIGTSGKSLALGNIQGLTPQASAIYENPASIGQINQLQHSLMYTVLADQKTNYLSWAMVLPREKFNWGFGLTRLAVPHLQETDINSSNEFFVVDNFGVSEYLVKGAMSYQLRDDLNLGASLSFFRQDLYRTIGRGLNMTVGAYWHQKRYQSSVVLQNALPWYKVNYTQTGRRLDFPFRLVTGTRALLWQDFVGYAQITLHSRPSLFTTAYGLEWMPSKWDKRLSFLFGWKDSVVANHRKQRPSLGLSMNLAGLNVQFAYEHTEFQDNDKRYSLSMTMDL